jgi:hypothetical protein
MSNRRRHPQVIRAKELAREAGLDPYARIEHPRDSWRSRPVYSDFMDAAFDEHFAREAIDNIYWDHGGSFYTERWDIPRRDDDCRFYYGRCKSGHSKGERFTTAARALSDCRCEACRKCYAAEECLNYVGVLWQLRKGEAA